MTFRWPTKEAFVLRTDAAFAAMGAWEARSEAAWAAAQALVGGSGLGGFGCLEDTIVVFAAMGAWEARSEAAWAAWKATTAGGG